MNIWDFVNSINQNKKDLFEDPLAEKDYVPFLVNKALSYYVDTIFFANEMNSRTHLSKRQQFDFLRFSVTKKKRYSKWHKKQIASEDISAVCEYYKYSQAKAYEVMSILTEQQIKDIKQSVFKGGKS